MESFREKDSMKQRKSQALTWEVRKYNALPSIFLADLSKVYRKFLMLHVLYTISTLLVLVVGKATCNPVHKLNY